MEWYALQFCRATVQDASFFGALQLILLAAVLIFRIPLARPLKEEE